MLKGDTTCYQNSWSPRHGIHSHRGTGWGDACDCGDLTMRRRHRYHLGGIISIEKKIKEKTLKKNPNTLRLPTNTSFQAHSAIPLTLPGIEGAWTAACLRWKLRHLRRSAFVFSFPSCWTSHRLGVAGIRPTPPLFDA